MNYSSILSTAKTGFHLINPTMILAVMGLSSCTMLDKDTTVTDMGFEIEPMAVWMPEAMGWGLRLDLCKGDPKRTYSMTYCIDDVPSLRLLSPSGSDVNVPSELDFEKGLSSSFSLPRLEPGKSHSISLEVSSEKIRRSYNLSLPDTNQKAVDVLVDPNSSYQSTRVTLSSTVGKTLQSYSALFLLDGKQLDGIRYQGVAIQGNLGLSFTKESFFMVELPFITPGSHILSVTIMTEKSSETTEIQFNEPQRKKTTLEMSYNPFSGSLDLSSSYNPQGIGVNVTLDITVEGEVIFRHRQFLGGAKPKTESFRLTDEVITSFIPGQSPQSIDQGGIRRLMDGIFDNSRDDADNLIGNGNHRTVHADITAVRLSLTIRKESGQSGYGSSSSTTGESSPTVILPNKESDLPIVYSYCENTWSHDKGDIQKIIPEVRVNGETLDKVLYL